MSLPVHWVESLAGVRPGDVVSVDGDEAHHAVAVRRLRPGERLVLTDGVGTTVVGTVAETAKRHLTVSADQVEHVAEPVPRITVVQAVPKGDRGELAVEVLTEVGVATIVPWAASRSVAVWRGDRVDKGLARWRATAREAAKQARRAWFPEVAALASTDDVATLVAAASVAVVLHEGADDGPVRRDGARRRQRAAGGRSRRRAQRRGAGGVPRRRGDRRTAGVGGAPHLDGRRRGGGVGAGPHPALALTRSRVYFTVMTRVSFAGLSFSDPPSFWATTV